MVEARPALAGSYGSRVRRLGRDDHPGAGRNRAGRGDQLRLGRPARALEDRRGHEVGRGTTDRFGSLIFRELEPGTRLRRPRRRRRRHGPGDGARRSRTIPTRASTSSRRCTRASTTSRRATARCSRPWCARRSARSLADGPFPTAGRVLRLRGRRSRQPAAVVADRERARLRDRRRQHARLGLLGRRHRPVRPADHRRRLRHHRDRRGAAVGAGRQGRHDRHLVPGHQPALRRRRAAAAPGGDRAALGHRRHLPLARASPAASSTTASRETWLQERADDAAARARGRPGVGHQAGQQRRHDLPREPAAAPADAGPGRVHARRTRSTRRR